MSDDGQDVNTTPWRGSDHLQLAICRDGEETAGESSAIKLGMPEVSRPLSGAARGGDRFELTDAEVDR